MHITDAKINFSANSMRGAITGCIIIFISDENVIGTDIFCLNFLGKNRYFQVYSIKLFADNKLLVYANQIGYYNILEKDINFDLRDILNMPIMKITDEKIKQEVNKEKCYC